MSSCWLYDYNLDDAFADSGTNTMSESGDGDGDTATSVPLRMRDLIWTVPIRPNLHPRAPATEIKQLKVGVTTLSSTVTNNAGVVRTRVITAPILWTPTYTNAAGALSTVVTPAYPAASVLEAHPTPGAVWWYVPTTVTPPGGGCAILTMTRFNNFAELRQKPVMNNLANNAVPKVYDFQLQPRVNPDHVCKSLLHHVDTLLMEEQMKSSY